MGWPLQWVAGGGFRGGGEAGEIVYDGVGGGVVVGAVAESLHGRGGAGIFLPRRYRQVVSAA